MKEAIKDILVGIPAIILSFLVLGGVPALLVYTDWMRYVVISVFFLFISWLIGSVIRGEFKENER